MEGVGGYRWPLCRATHGVRAAIQQLAIFKGKKKNTAKINSN
jgi:hypothetical protein